MSSNKNNITVSNYEEYFILYMDNELDANGRQMVEAFVSLHPHLAEELDLLMTTKLPADAASYNNKEELLSSCMKLNSVDEELLLYIDDELSAAQKTSVGEKISNNKDYALQYSLLMQTKVDATEIMSYPNKKELYRYSEKVIDLPLWMRMAVAVILIIFSLLYLIISTQQVAEDLFAAKPLLYQFENKDSPLQQKNIFILQQKEEPVLVKAPETKKSNNAILKTRVQNKNKQQVIKDVAMHNNELPKRKREVIKFDESHLATAPTINDVAVNKTIAHTPVTSPLTVAYNNQNDPTVAAVTDGDFEIEKKTRGKGFFRKVSRFIQRNTGIGTVNADNELLIGAVALKLK